MDRGLIWPAVVLAVLLVVGFVALVTSGHDTGEYVVFVTGPLVSAIVGAVLVKRVATTKAVVDVVAHQTNSLLSTRLDTIDTALGEAKTDRDAIACVNNKRISVDTAGPELVT